MWFKFRVFFSMLFFVGFNSKLFCIRNSNKCGFYLSKTFFGSHLKKNQNLISLGQRAATCQVFHCHKASANPSFADEHRDAFLRHCQEKAQRNLSSLPVPNRLFARLKGFHFFKLRHQLSSCCVPAFTIAPLNFTFVFLTNSCFDPSRKKSKMLLCIIFLDHLFEAPGPITTQHRSGRILSKSFRTSARASTGGRPFLDL